jgi:hypothetical protein
MDRSALLAAIWIDRTSCSEMGRLLQNHGVSAMPSPSFTKKRLEHLVWEY